MTGSITAAARLGIAARAMVRPAVGRRHAAHRLIITGIATACLSGILPGLVHACSAALEGGKTVDSPRYRIAYRTDPTRIAVGKPFAVDLIVCPTASAGMIDELRVDAHMPEHRHGMNYKASVKPQGIAGRYRAEGLMFHMPGKWEFLFDVRDANGVERLQQDYPVK